MIVAFWNNPKARLGCVVVLTLVTFAAIGLLTDPIISSGNKTDILLPPSTKHWFGTTIQGQDVFAMTILGAAPTIFFSLFTGLGITLLSTAIGVSAGYLGGKADTGLSLLTNVFLLIPGLPLMIVLAALLPTGPLSIALVLIFTGWPWGARVLRSQALTLRQRPFIEAAQLSGESRVAIIVRHVIPNMASLLGTSFIGATNYALGAAVGLEFLGFGDPSSVTWGTNLYWATNDQALLTGAWWTFVPTGIGIALYGFGLALLTFALDEITNPGLTARRRFKQVVGLAPDLDTPVRRGGSS